MVNLSTKNQRNLYSINIGVVAGADTGFWKGGGGGGGGNCLSTKTHPFSPLYEVWGVPPGHPPPPWIRPCSGRMKAVYEIKGAPCARRAHFHGRVHDFQRCAPGVCTFFEPFCIAIYLGGCMDHFPGAQF